MIKSEPDGWRTCNVILCRIWVNIVPLQKKTFFWGGGYFCYPTCSCQPYKTAECCHGDARTGSLCTAVQPQNIPYCSQQCTCTVLRSLHKAPDTAVRFQPSLGFVDRFSKRLQCNISRKPFQCGPWRYVLTNRQTDRHEEVNRRFSCSCERA